MTMSLGILTDRIGRLALVEWPEGELPPPLDDLAPPGVDKGAILLVRRVVVVAEPERVRQVVEAELDAAVSAAARPARGCVEAGAEAVLFADQAELVACYLLSLGRAGVVPGWVWEQLAGSLPPPTLPAVLRDPATPLVPVVAALDSWGRLDEVVGGLDAEAERRMVEAVAVRHGLQVRTVDSQTGGPRPSCLPEDDPPAAEMRPAGWDVHRPGSGVILGRVDAGDGFAASLGLLARALLGRADAATVLRSEAFGGRPANGRSSTPADPPTTTAATPMVVGDRADGGTAPQAGAPTVVAETGGNQDGDDARRADGRFRLGGLDPHAVDTEPSVGQEILGATALTGAAEGVATGAGGVLYLVNPYRELDLPGAGLADTAPWEVVEGLGRAALQAAGLLDESDALWDVLAALAGRSPGQRPGPDVVSRCREALLGIVADLELRPEEPRPGDLLLVPGRLHVDHSLVQLVAPMEAVNLCVRRRALDADPGWVPALGRIIRFHFVHGGAS